MLLPVGNSWNLTPVPTLVLFPPYSLGYDVKELCQFKDQASKVLP